MGRKLQTAAGLDLSPAMHWRRPVFAQLVDGDQGPVLVTIQYRIDPKDRAPFLAVMRENGFERKRDGAYAWNVFEDAGEVGRVVEVFLVQSMLELQHLRQRVTKFDQMVEAEAHRYLTEPPKVTILVAPKRSRERRRKSSATLAPAAAE